MTFKDIFQKYLKTPKEELVLIAKECSSYIISSLTKHFNDKDEALDFYFKLYATFVCSDGVAQQNEYVLFNEITSINCDYDKYFNVMSLYYKEKDKLEIIEVLDQLNQEVIDKCIVLGLIICAIDGKMTLNEQKLIERYFR